MDEIGKKLFLEGGSLLSSLHYHLSKIADDVILGRGGVERIWRMGRTAGKRNVKGAIDRMMRRVQSPNYLPS